MFRRELLELLRDAPRTLWELAQLLDADKREIEEDLHHLEKSLRHGPERLAVDPARCRKCGFVFKADKLHKPGKCPHCKGTWITEPRVSVRAA